MLLVFFNKRLQAINFGPAETPAFLKPYRFQPEFSPPRLTLDMNVGRLSTVGRVEEDSVRPDPENRGHPTEVYTYGVAA